MSANLVIVESPAKAKTIQKFLGKSYKVVASNGHVRDLPKSTMGIDIENDFEPKYITIRGKGDILAQLRKEVKKADKVYLATDPDREGEAISWHLYHALKLENKKCSRITFNEITKDAVKNSIKNSRDIDMNLVDAQQARRVLDRIVGYKISPILWSKIKRGLSAGRVQSVALRIICDREQEIDEFISQEYWSLIANILVPGAKKPLEAHFVGDQTGKLELHSQAEVAALIEKLQHEKFEVLSVKSGERKKKPPLPFTTSTLQQEASKRLNMSTQKTMRLAQELYEGVTLKGKGSIGLITYLRTDSTRISEEADASCREYIAEQYGEAFVGNKQTGKTTKTGKIQDAHEAIRPTDSSLSPALLKDQLPRDLFRLYQLIWTRFLASRMSEAVYETTSVKIGAGDYRFNVAASKVKFDGFMTIYSYDNEKSTMNAAMKKITKDTEITLSELIPQQHFTQPPAHFTEASLVKTLEELGLTFEISSEEYNSEYADGYIISQDPLYADNYNVKMGTTVKVVVSKGIEEATVPDVKGKSKDDAVKLLEDAKLKYQIVEEESKKIEAGYVVSQETEANKKVNAGDTVIIHVSTGVKKSAVASVVGKDEEEAKKTLTDLGLTVTVIDGEDYSKENGVVLKQSLDAGKEVEEGTKITITVNKLTETKSATLTVNVKSLLGGKVEYEEIKTNDTNSSNDTNNTENNTTTNSTTTKVPKDVEVRIVVGDDTVYKGKVDPTTTQLYQTISGKGTVTVKVYIDDVLKSTKDVNLNNTSKVTIE